MRSGHTKAEAYRFGHFAESLCAFSLRLRGYRILEKRYRTHVGEIDIIAACHPILAIVEVKARTGKGCRVEETLQANQRRRIERTAGAYLALHPEYAGYQLRFDLMTVRPWQIPQHLKGAWIAGE